jgi:hypothetical protein
MKAHPCGGEFKGHLAFPQRKRLRVFRPPGLCSGIGKMGDDAPEGGRSFSVASNFNDVIMAWRDTKPNRDLDQPRGVFAGGVEVQKGAPGLVGQFHGMIAREIAKKRRGGAEEAQGAVGDATGDVGSFDLVTGLIDEQMHFSGQAGLVDGFHDSIGIESGGQIRRRHDHDFVCQAEKMHDLRGDPGAGIEQQEIVIFGDMTEIAADAQQPHGIEIGEPRNPGGATDEPNAFRSGRDGILERGAALENVGQGLTRSHTCKDVGVRHAKVGVEEKDAPPEPRESDRQVHGSGGFADASLSARHGDHPSVAHGGGEFLADSRERLVFDEEPAVNLLEARIAVAMVEKRSEVLFNELELAWFDSREWIGTRIGRLEAVIHGKKKLFRRSSA